MSLYLKPFSFLYDQIVGLKNSLYEKGVLSVYKPNVPVVSIGNLTVGGTGKTPVTDFCLKDLVAKEKKVAVISRSYRADASSPCRVDVGHPYAARYFGDEPVLLAQQNPQVSVFVGPKKWQTAQYAVSENQFDLLIVDDGFQHRKLHRDLNVVILDATENIENYEVLPEGRAREPWSELHRADLLVLTKCNLARAEDLRILEERLPKEIETLYFSYEIKRFKRADQKVELSVADLKGKNIFLVSAIARPDVFEKMMGEVGVVSRKSLIYRDHHQYTSEDVTHILNEFKKSQADFFVTTEKDVVKLRSLLPDSQVLWGASLEVQELGQKGRLHEIIQQALR